jgi:hypothetical protein
MISQGGKRWLLIFTILVFLIVFFSYPFSTEAKNLISWMPERIELTIGIGESKDLTVNFMSTQRIENIDLWVCPELQPFISVTPNHYEVVEANTPYKIKMNLSIPQNIETRIYEGTIHIRNKSKTYPQTLNIKLDVVIFQQKIKELLSSFSSALLTNNRDLAKELFSTTYQEKNLAHWDSMPSGLKTILGQLLSEDVEIPSSISNGQIFVTVDIPIMDENQNISYGALVFFKEENGKWKIKDW